MCFGGMSKTAKDLTGKTVDLANSMASQAKKVFGAADDTFHTISSALTGIVNRGESQFGFSNGEFTARNAAAVNAGATMKRNLQAQAAASGQPYNAAAIDQEVANKTAEATNANTVAGWDRGNQNFFKATGQLEAAPGMYDVANKSNENAMSGLQTATTAQENRDASAFNWKQALGTVAGDVGGAFIGDPGLGGQITSTFGKPGGGSGGSGGGSDPFSKLFSTIKGKFGGSSGSGNGDFGGET